MLLLAQNAVVDCTFAAVEGQHEPTTGIDLPTAMGVCESGTGDPLYSMIELAIVYGACLCQSANAMLCREV